MKEPVFILVVGNDLSACSGLISRIQPSGTSKKIYEVSDSSGFIEAVTTIEDADGAMLQTEIRVIIDLDLPFFEAYVCLQALAHYDYKCPVRVYLLEGEHTIKASPSVEQYVIAGRFNKPLNAIDIEDIMADHQANYFQKEVSNTSDGSVNKFW